MSETENQVTPPAPQGNEEIDVTELVERIEALEKISIEEKTVRADVEKRLADCESSIDVIAQSLE